MSISLVIMGGIKLRFSLISECWQNWTYVAGKFRDSLGLGWLWIRKTGRAHSCWANVTWFNNKVSVWICTPSTTCINTMPRMRTKSSNFLTDSILFLTNDHIKLISLEIEPLSCGFVVVISETHPRLSSHNIKKCRYPLFKGNTY